MSIVLPDDINAPVHPSGLRVLHTAAKMGNLELVQIILDRGADPNQQDNNGYTPLYCAAEHAHVAVMRLLIERGADVRANTAHTLNGDTLLTPLHSITDIGSFSSVDPERLEGVMLLLRQGANPSARSNRFETPLDRALEMRRNGALGYDEIIAALRIAEVEVARGGQLSTMIAPLVISPQPAPTEARLEPAPTEARLDGSSLPPYTYPNTGTYSEATSTACATISLLGWIAVGFGTEFGVLPLVQIGSSSWVVVVSVQAVISLWWICGPNPREGAVHAAMNSLIPLYPALFIVQYCAKKIFFAGRDCCKRMPDDAQENGAASRHNNDAA